MDAPGTAHKATGHRRSLARRLVVALDGWLRRRGGIVEYSDHPRCIYRLQIIWLDRELKLSDGVHARPGDRAVMLHLWNEQIPTVPDRGAGFGWARRFTSALELSLGELARYLAARPQLDDICLIGMPVNIATAQKNLQLLRILARLGFEAGPRPQGRPVPARLHQLGDNIWGTFLVLAYNPAAFRWNNFWRSPLQVFASREMLLRRYGNDSDRR
jgi:hypothetical protein